MILNAVEILLLQSQQVPKTSLDWSFIGSCIAFVSLIAAIAIGVVQIKATRPPKKNIRCIITSQAPLITVVDGFKSRLKIVFDNKEIENPISVQFLINNSGSLSIRAEDFERPIFFMFGQSSEILSAEVLKTSQKSIRAKISIEQNGIELEPLLLNSGDSIEISCVISSPGKIDIDIDARISDIKHIKIEKLQEIIAKQKEREEIVSASISSLILIIGIIYSCITFLRDPSIIKDMFDQIFSLFQSTPK